MSGLPPVLFADLSRHREGLNMETKTPNLCIQCRDYLAEWVFEPYCSLWCNDTYKAGGRGKTNPTKKRR